MLTETVHISLGLKELEAHLARAPWNSGDAEEATGNWDEAKDLEARARATRGRLKVESVKTRIPMKVFIGWLPSFCGSMTLRSPTVDN